MISFKSGRSKVKFNVNSLDDLINDILPRLKLTEVWFSDLDGSDAKSPAKIITKNALCAGYFNFKYLKWCLASSYNLLIKKDYTKMWQNYVNAFLNTDEALAEVKNFFNTERLKNTVYPGVERFYSLLNAEKYYVTRNIEQVANVYAEYFGFNGTFWEVNDKGKIVENFIMNNPWFEYYGCSGDSVEDEEMFNVLKFYYRKRKIKSVVTLYCKKKLKKNVDICTTKDRTALVDVMTKFCLNTQG